MKSRYTPVRMGGSIVTSGSSSSDSGINNSDNKNGNKRRSIRQCLAALCSAASPFAPSSSRNLKSSSNPVSVTNKKRSNYLVPFLFVSVGIFIVFTIFSKQQQQTLKVAKEAAVSLSTDKNNTSSSRASSSGSTPVLTSSKTKVSASYLRQQHKQKQQNSIVNKDGEEAQCGIFLAPSSLKGGTFAPLGIFTTRDIPSGQDIFNGAPNGPAIALFDVLAGSSHTLAPKREDDGHEAQADSHLTVRDWDNSQDYDDTDQRQFWLAIFNNYWWGIWNMPDFSLFEADNVVDYQITTGIFPNHHCVLASIDFNYPDHPYDDSMVNRNDFNAGAPGAGAFSYHMGRHYTVSRDIQAGDELFLDYLDCDKNATLDREWEKAVPKTAEYFEAADLVWQHYEQINKNKDNPNVHTARLFDYDKDSGKLIVRHPSRSDARVMSLLPQTRTDFLTLLSRIDVQNYNRDELMLQLAKMATIEPRTPEWIRQNGQCLEHLKPGPSRLGAIAGQGGIAQHRIAQGELVVPSPMLHILDKRILKIYNNQGVDSKRIQLLMNYCFGHEESSLLLCPTTNAILINHCSTRLKNCGRDGKQGPNARFEWSLGDKEKNPWLKMTIDDMAKQAAHRADGLAMNVIATRDIAPGEEVFVDYGIEWELAWERHVASWKPPKEKDRIEPWVSAKEANENGEPIYEWMIARDLRHEMDHPYLFTGCQYWTTDEDYHADYRKRNDNWVNLSDEEIINTYADDGSQFGDFESVTTTGGNLGYWPCSVLVQDESEDEDENENDDDEGASGGTYTVAIHQSDFYDSTPWSNNEVPRILYNFPRAGIRYFVRPYASDQHLANAFRHSIGIPDEIFPRQWKNLPKTKND